jgi:hypothetical protein
VAELSARQADIFQLIVLKLMKFEELPLAAPVADELAQG